MRATRSKSATDCGMKSATDTSLPLSHRYARNSGLEPDEAESPVPRDAHWMWGHCHGGGDRHCLIGALDLLQSFKG